MTKITYHKETVVEETDLSLTLLQISLKHGIPHINSCGGTACCTTCRVKVLEGFENLHTRNIEEEKLARKKGFSHDIRLACQTKIKGPVTIKRLIQDDKNINLDMIHSMEDHIRQKNIAVLFCDIRNFTSFVEENLPYDVIHILNRYFYQMGEAIHQNHGIIDKYIGDAIMAIFGLHESDPKIICIDAITTALQMLNDLKKLNKYYKKHFGVEFEVGIGIHYGEALVGEMGHPELVLFTAIGDVVNVASRIETLSKQSDEPIIISEDVYRHIDGYVKKKRTIQTGLKGKYG